MLTLVDKGGRGANVTSLKKYWKIVKNLDFNEINFAILFILDFLNWHSGRGG